MAEPSASESSPETDRDFDPTAEMLVNDFDDERTLEEEEALESGEEAKHELDDLHKEGDMPIEELLAMYGYGDNNQADNTQSSSSEEILSNQDLTLDKDEIARDLLKDEDIKKETTIHDLLSSVDASVSTSRLLRSAVSHHHSESDTETEDEDYVPDDDDDWKKVFNSFLVDTVNIDILHLHGTVLENEEQILTIQVGSDFQAVIPEGLSKYDDAPAYENDDKSLWDPSKLTDQEVEDYLQAAEQPQANHTQGVDSVPTGCHVRDDEQALYLLLQCGHSIEEALRRRRMQTVLPTDTMSLWSEEECRSFENGLRTYGKDFHLIQQHKVRTRSVGELVQFYYLWKKTERHDVFANKARLEKKKYTLHPGTTDYMDRFLDEQENPPQQRDRSLSPNVNSLISGDYKRQHHNRTPPMTSYLSPPENHHHHHHHHHHYHHPQPPTLAQTTIATSPVLNSTMAIESSPTPASEVSLPLAGVQGFLPLSFGNLASSGNHVSPPTVFTNVAVTCPTRPKVADLSQDSKVGADEHLKAVSSVDRDCLDPVGRLGTGSGELAQAETSNGVGVASATCGSEHKAHTNFDIVSPRATALNSVVVSSSASE